MNPTVPEVAARVEAVLDRLGTVADPSRLVGMARYGIPTDHAYGVAVPQLRSLARELGRDHELALALWDSGIHEARILAGMVDDPAQVEPAQVEHWLADLDSWDVCDQLCSNLLRRTPFAHEAARAWITRPEPFVKRAGFAVLAALAVHDRRSPDELFAALLPEIARHAADPHSLARKGASWALRQIGKRSPQLRALAVDTALVLAREPATRWVGRDVLRELGGAAGGTRRADRTGR